MEPECSSPHYSIPPLVSGLSQINRVHIPLFKVPFNIILPFTSASSRLFLSFCLFAPGCATFPKHLVLPYLITQVMTAIMFAEVYKSWSSFLYSFSTVLCHFQISFSAPNSRTLSAYVLPLMRETKFRTHVKWDPVITAFRRGGGGVTSNA